MMAAEVQHEVVQLPVAVAVVEAHMHTISSRINSSRTNNINSSKRQQQMPRDLDKVGHSGHYENLVPGCVGVPLAHLPVVILILSRVTKRWLL